MKKVLLIIPAYNEEKNIKATVDNVLSHSPGTAYQLDYIVVNLSLIHIYPASDIPHPARLLR